VVVALLLQAIVAGSAAVALGADPSAEPSPIPTETLPPEEPSAEPSKEATTPVTLGGPISDADPSTVEVVEAVLPEPDPGLQPSVHYEDAMAHAEDQISFKPGGPVTRTLTQAPGTGDIAVAGGTRRLKQVFGFLPYWEVSDSANTLDYRVLSTIAYFSVGSDQKGNLLKKNADGTATTGWGGFGSAALTNVINNAHANDTRVVLTITMFAWTSSQAERQAALLGSPAARQNLARQAALAVHNRGIDGINLDFEPIVTGYADEFTALVRTFRSELDALAPGYQLTFDTTGWIGNYPIEDATAPGGADAIFIMGYDYRTASVPTVGSISPLAGPAYDIADTVAAFAARVPASKLILGVPYYGRAWSTETDAVNSKNISGVQYGSSNTVIYTTAIEYAATHGRRWDGRELGPYVVYHRENCTPAYGCVNPWRQIYYDDAQSLGLKYDLVNSMGLAGTGMWALGYDDGRNELNEALAGKFLTTDTTGESTYTPVTAVRLLDTRTGNGLAGKFTSRAPRTFFVAGRGGIPADATAVTGNLTVTEQTSSGFLTLSPIPDASPSTSTLNFPSRDTRANNVTVRLSAGGGLSVVFVGASGARAHVLFDVTGYFREGTDGARFTALEPTRLLDTRTGLGLAGTFASGTPRTFAVAGLGGVPAGAIAVAGNLTVTGQTRPGFVSVGPVPDGAPTTSSLNFPMGDTRANGVVVPLGSGGTLSAVYVSAVPGSVQLIFDVTGYFATGGSGAVFVPVNPARLLDTRSGNGLSGAFRMGAPRTFAVAGRGGVPINASAVTGNLTVVRQTRHGHLSLGPSVGADPSFSTLNFPTSDVRANGVAVDLDGRGDLSNVYVATRSASTDVLFDVTGYFR
jgi:spore germination protein YaaH